MGFYAKKSLGQHFLHSPSALAKIIEAATLKKEEVVLEIGPGTGILTKALLDTGVKVIAVEKDDRAHELLRQRFATEIASGSFILHSADILETDRSAFGLKDGEYAVVANIPYYITGAILESFLEHEPRPNRMVLLVQKEVADRIVAADGKESILSISVKAFGTPRSVAKVPRGAFVPPPNVDSAILAISDISDARFRVKGLKIRAFFDMVKAGFAHKRKYLKKNLETVSDKAELDSIWQMNGLDEKIRAEDLGLEDWFKIASRS